MRATTSAPPILRASSIPKSPPILKSPPTQTTTPTSAFRANPSGSPRVFLFLPLALCLVFVASTSSAVSVSGQTPAEEVIETTGTRAGELSLVRRKRDEATTIVIKLNGKVLAEKEASAEGDAYSEAGVYGAYPKSSPRFVLVRLGTGALTCASKFAVVDLSPGSGARVTEDFGNCNDVPRVAHAGNSLTITFPDCPRRHDPGSH